MNIKRMRNIQNYLLTRGLFLDLTGLMDEDEFDTYLDKVANLLNIGVDPETVFYNCLEPMAPGEFKSLSKGIEALKTSYLEGVDLGDTSIDQLRLVQKHGRVSQKEYERMGKIDNLKKLGDDFAKFLVEASTAGFDFSKFGSEFKSLKPDLNRSFVDMSLFLKNKTFLLFDSPEAIIGALLAMQNENVKEGDLNFDEDNYRRAKFNAFVMNLVGYEVDSPLVSTDDIISYFEEGECITIRKEFTKVKRNYGIQTIEDISPEGGVFNWDLMGLTDVVVCCMIANNYDFDKIEQVLGSDIGPLTYLAFLIMDLEGVSYEKYIEEITLTGEGESYGDLFSIKVASSEGDIDVDNILESIGGRFANQEDSLFYLTMGGKEGIDTEFCIDYTLNKFQDISRFKDVVETYMFGLHSGVDHAEISFAFMEHKEIPIINNYLLFKKIGLEPNFSSNEVDIEKLLIDQNELDL